VDISIQCRACGHKLLITKNQLGHKGRCPVCSAVMRLPSPVDLGPRLKEPPPVDPTRARPEAQSLPSFAMACPACHARMRLLEKYRGTVVRCPDCNEPFTAEVVVEEPAEDEGE
jgi:hypothetical protein